MDKPSQTAIRADVHGHTGEPVQIPLFSAWPGLADKHVQAGRKQAADPDVRTKSVLKKSVLKKSVLKKSVQKNSTDKKKQSIRETQY